MRAFAIAAGLAVLLLSRTAGAETPPTGDVSPAAPTTRPAKTERFRPFAITANPLSLGLVKFGFNAEWLPVKHHALVLSPSYQLGTLRTPELDTRHRVITVEAGYHYYVGSRGADGVYFGPSLVFSRERADVEATTNETLALESVRLAFGGAFDFGGQVVMSKGFTAGAGVGVMYLFGLGGAGTKVADTVHRDTVLPRLLCTVGYSF